jgi:hypothetical protein
MKFAKIRLYKIPPFKCTFDNCLKMCFLSFYFFFYFCTLHLLWLLWHFFCTRYSKLIRFLVYIVFSWYVFCQENFKYFINVWNYSLNKQIGVVKSQTTFLTNKKPCTFNVIFVLTFVIKLTIVCCRARLYYVPYSLPMTFAVLTKIDLLI